MAWPGLIRPGDLLSDSETRELETLLSARPGSAAGFTREVTVRGEDGTLTPFVLAASKIGDASSRVVLLQFLPPAAGKREKTSLTERDNIWRQALEGAGQGVWDHDLIRGKVQYSPAWYRMRGFQPGEDIDRELGSWLERIHPDDRPSIILSTQRQDKGELRDNAFEYRERHRDGGWVWILSRGRPVERLPNGAVARIVGTDTDITSLKQIENQLADEKERLRVTLQSVADGIIATDAQGNVTFINPAAEALTGWTLSQAVGQPARQILTLLSTDGSVPPCPVRLSISKAEPVVLEDNSVLVNAAGEIRDISLTSSPLRNSDGLVMGAVVVFQDVTRSRNLQRELAHSASHDPLTGLPNRVAFDRALRNAIDVARNVHSEHALCYIDLDHFKFVNDTAGHAAGDELLRHIAALIKQACRSSDFVGRIGGDEFVMLLMECDLQRARSICEKLTREISAFVFRWEDQTFQVGASIGITAVTCRQPSTSQLTKQADAACYAAKRNGRGVVSIFDAD